MSDSSATVNNRLLGMILTTVRIHNRDQTDRTAGSCIAKRKRDVRCAECTSDYTIRCRCCVQELTIRLSTHLLVQATGSTISVNNDTVTVNRSHPYVTTKHGGQCSLLTAHWPLCQHTVPYTHGTVRADNGSHLMTHDQRDPSVN